MHIRSAPVLVLALVVCVATASPAVPAPDNAADTTTDAVQKAVARVGPSLVRLNVVEAEYEKGKETKSEAVGSGAIISADGYVITNHHVAGTSKRIVCVLNDNEEVEATLVGTDPLSDIAVVKLQGAPGRRFPAVEFGDSDQLRVGQEALAMGNPLALAKAVTRGIVSNTRMVMPGSYQRRGGLVLQGESVGTMVRWLVHDARIFPGNSGGPLVDLEGRVIGINEVSFGLAGAIPANLAKEVARQLIDHGRVRRGWLGMEFQPLPKGSSLERGALVREVVEGSPAGLAGIRSGDVLLALGDADMTARFDEEIPVLNQRVASLAIGTAVDVRVLREGRELALPVTPIERQPLQLPDAELVEWGITARDLSFLSATELKLQDTGGILVTSVRSAGPAGKSRPALEAGDVIHDVAGHPVRTLKELEDVSAGLTKDHDDPVPTAVRFTRTPEDLLTVIDVGHAPKERIAADARKAWLPAATQVITRQMATGLGDPSLAGVRITQVYPAGTAEKAGLRVGDLIVALDGTALESGDQGNDGAFADQLRQYAVGSRPKLTVIRGKEKLEVEVELERSPKLDRELRRYENEEFEFKTRDVGFFDRVHEGWSPDRNGAMVTEVSDGGWADLGELYAGDLVTAVDGKEIADVGALESRMKELAATKPSHVMLRVLRGIHIWYLQLETPWSHS